MMAEFPVMSGADGHFAPPDMTCLKCHRSLEQDGVTSFVYLSGGAMLMSENRQTGHADDRISGFLSIGSWSEREMDRGPAPIDIITNLTGGQFSIQWCSVDCMRQWLLGVLTEVEGRV
jgi:hypothetical protein